MMGCFWMFQAMFCNVLQLSKEAFQLVYQAFHVLANPESRKKYHGRTAWNQIVFSLLQLIFYII